MEYKETWKGFEKHKFSEKCKVFEKAQVFEKASVFGKAQSFEQSQVFVKAARAGKKLPITLTLSPTAPCAPPCPTALGLIGPRKIE